MPSTRHHGPQPKPRACAHELRLNEKVRLGLCRSCYMAQYREKNAARISQQLQAYREAHRDESRADTKARYKANPEAFKARCYARRVKAKGAGSFTRAEWQGRIKAYQGRCAYCNTCAKLVVEHVVPLSKGGANTINNIVPACAPCNARKGAKTWTPRRVEAANGQ